MSRTCFGCRTDSRKTIEAMKELRELASRTLRAAKGQWRRVAIAIVTVWPWLTRVALYFGAYAIFAAYIDKPAFPSVAQLLEAATGPVREQLVGHLIMTLWRWLKVFSVGVLVAVPCGILMGLVTPIYNRLSPDVDFFRSLPATVLVTFVQAAFGDNEQTRAMPAFHITFFTMLFYVAKHTRLIDKTRLNHLEELGASKLFVFWHCVLNELMPATMVAVRQAVSLSFLVLVSVELIIGSEGGEGIGQILYDWQFHTKYANIIVSLLCLGACGYLMNISMLAIHRRLTPWQQVD